MQQAGAVEEKSVEERAKQLIKDKNFDQLINELPNYPDCSLSSQVAGNLIGRCGMLTVMANRSKFNIPPLT